MAQQPMFNHLSNIGEYYNKKSMSCWMNYDKLDKKLNSWLLSLKYKDMVLHTLQVKSLLVRPEVSILLWERMKIQMMQ